MYLKLEKELSSYIDVVMHVKLSICWIICSVVAFFPVAIDMPRMYNLFSFRIDTFNTHHLLPSLRKWNKHTWRTRARKNPHTPIERMTENDP